MYIIALSSLSRTYKTVPFFNDRYPIIPNNELRVASRIVMWWYVRIAFFQCLSFYRVFEFDKDKVNLGK